MQFNIISNLNNGAGLQRSYEILRQELERRGHQVAGVQFDKVGKPQPADVNIFIETVRCELFEYASQQWVIPMPEWWDMAWFNLSFDKVLTLTHDGHRLFSQRYKDRCRYLGWRARDLLDMSVSRERKFLHVAGKSPYKNTQAVIDGCRMANVPLTVIDAQHRVSDFELQRLMNSHIFHLMPSAYEGYGYVLHEALGVGAVLLTTDAPPMNEVTPSFLIPSHKTRPCHAATLHLVEPAHVAEAVRRAMSMNQQEIDAHCKQARDMFIINERNFNMNLDVLLGEV